MDGLTDEERQFMGILAGGRDTHSALRGGGGEGILRIGGGREKMSTLRLAAQVALSRM